MEVSSYTSNVQPYGSQSGTKFALENENTGHISLPKDSERMDNVAERLNNEQLNKRQAESIDDAMEMAKERTHLNEKQRAKMVEQMNEFVSSLNKGLSFRVDEESGRDVITIYEAETGDIIRQIPEEEMLKVLRRLASGQDHRSGLLMTQV